MAEALPAGDIHPPNSGSTCPSTKRTGQSTSRAVNVLATRCLSLSQSTLRTFFNSQVADGSLVKKRECQIKQRMRRKVCHKLRQRFDEKVHGVMEQCHGGDDCHSRQGSKYYGHNHKWQDWKDSGHCNNYDKRKKKNRRTGPLLIAAKSHLSHARCMGRRASTPPRSATKTPRTTNVKFRTKNVNTRCIPTTPTI